jgi:transposase-like protein
LTCEVLGSVSFLSASSIGVRGLRLPAEVIVVAARWYLRYGLSYRDVEELLAERGIEVDHVSVYRWVAFETKAAAKDGCEAVQRAANGAEVVEADA